MRVGISIILAEKQIQPYDNNLNIVRRVNELKLKAAESLQKLANLKSGK